MLLAILLAGSLQAGERVDNFVLLDQRGESHELYYLSDSRAIVLMVHGNGCQIVRNALPELKAIRSDYAERGVEFLLINSNLQDQRDSIRAEA
ncbi:MAG: redoxin domain-containing protein, partial [Gammaproteobacteria bacterium]